MYQLDFKREDIQKQSAKGLSPPALCGGYFYSIEFACEYRIFYRFK
jgi:hypothetical protein